MVKPPQPSDSEAETRVQDHATDGAIFNFVSTDVDHLSFMSGSVYLVPAGLPSRCRSPSARPYSTAFSG
ncbi:hypothetical protein QBC33DRAFT_529980 [Phialemonium atrogriseum]|uniref:Uncharacterized protein n=1 Tax=Phialemonium atrogriseum TaxID=1093897 RepID=A0AAJ0C4Y8_9PEZI|nr:uncharacterized protein QBC33DRAFT_529980 [Phialemonium atrogriseum]KAK1770035.1 hypothetical protein QBC33DRAFT_529980 [Phialemonium atrogriseum]